MTRLLVFPDAKGEAVYKLSISEANEKYLPMITEMVISIMEGTSEASYAFDGDSDKTYDVSDLNL